MIHLLVLAFFELFFVADVLAGEYLAAELSQRIQIMQPPQKC